VKRFADSTFLIAAWQQYLETQAPGVGACASGSRVVTVGEVLAFFRGQVLDPVVEMAIGDHLIAVVAEACRTVRGRFAGGLPAK
jgi:hypothetical protein